MTLDEMQAVRRHAEGEIREVLERFELTTGLPIDALEVSMDYRHPVAGLDSELAKMIVSIKVTL